MPKITDTPPPEIAAELAELRAELDKTVPSKILDRNLLIATWNIRHLDDITKEWGATASVRGPRDLQSVVTIAEIIGRFDIVAVQEVRGRASALRAMLTALAPHWSAMMTDINRGLRGNLERSAFLFDTRKVIPSGLVAELVYPEQDEYVGASTWAEKQYARTPYAAGFRAGGKSFTLVTAHIIYAGADRAHAERLRELQAFARWLEIWVKDSRTWEHNIIALGDFQIDHRGSELYDAFFSTGLHTPEELLTVPRTVSQRSNRPLRLYDQIAWFNGDNDTPPLELRFLQGGSFDFTKVALKSRHLDWRQLMHSISDHMPLWAEFSLRD